MGSRWIRTFFPPPPQDAESVVLDLRDRGIQAVVGPGLIADLAANAGMGAVFLYSRASVRAAFDTALEVAQATRRETVRRQRLDCDQGGVRRGGRTVLSAGLRMDGARLSVGDDAGSGVGALR